MNLISLFLFTHENNEIKSPTKIYDFTVYESPTSSGKKTIAKVELEVILKVGQISRSRSQGQKLWYHVYKKVLSQRIHMSNMKALSLLVSKLWPRLKFFKSTCRSNFKVKVTRSKIMVPCERSCHKEYTYEIMKALSLMVWKLCPRLKFLSTQPTPTRTVGLWQCKGPCAIVPLTWEMANISLCRMIRNGPLKISKSLKKGENWLIGKNLFQITADISSPDNCPGLLKIIL